MTRETKIGMIVAGSFLSLVGVVVGTKLYKRDQPENKGPDLVASSTDPANKGLPPGAGAPSKSAEPGVQQAELRSPGPLPFAPPPGAPTFDPLAPPPPAPPVGPEATAKLQDTIGKQEKELHTHGDKTVTGVNTAINAGNKGVSEFGKQPPGNGFATLPPPDIGFPTPPLPTPTRIAQGPDSKGTPPPPAGLDLPPTVAPPAAPPTTVTPPTTSPNVAPSPPPIGTVPPIPMTPPTPGSVPPPIGNTTIPPPPIEPTAKDPPPAPPPFGTVPPPSNSGSTSPTPPPPAPIVAVPPIVNPTPPATPTAPTVFVGDEKRYVVKPGDTYASIAKNAYGDDRYAASLEDLNRSRIGAAAVTLQPGTSIVIPTPASLQNGRFAGGITQPTTTATPPSPPLVTPTPPPPSPPPSPPAAPTYPPITTSPATLAPGQPIPSVPPAPPFAPTTPAIVAPTPPPPPLQANRDPVSIGPVTSPNTRPATPPVPTGVTTYRIPAGGLLIAQVAQQQLGSPLRWIDIYRLNSNLDPSRPIPEGTEIRLPPR